MTSFKPIIFLYVLLFSPFAAATDIFDEYPTLFTHANGVSIAYQDMGTRDGFPVVLVMGLGAQLTYWGDPLVRALVEHGYRVVLLDNRDVGLSESYDYLGQPDMEGFMAGGPITLPYSLRDMADDVPALMTHLGINDAHIMGASMGGMIA
jgi:pimeloyl-ACP methyl ester carboxylesterase